MVVSVSNPIDKQALLAAAKAETGLDDFGAPSIDPALGIFVDALNSEAKLNDNGVRARNATIMRILTTRLKLQDRFSRQPEILNETIEGPITIVGLARSGTTKLQRMMAADARLQSLPLWKLLDPIHDGSADSETRRRAMAAGFVDIMKTAFPDFHAAHPMDAEQPDEEVFLMELTLRNNTLMHSAHIPTYREWLVQQDFTPWYDFLKRMLQFYQHQDGSAGRTWLLKAPFHLGHLPEYFEAFPKATILHCHRDPRTAIPSMCALFEASRRMASDTIDPIALGRVVMETWGGLMDAYMRDRPRYEGKHRFVDIAYRDILTDAPAQIGRAYEAAGLALTDEARAAMLGWEAENAQNKHGKHVYVLERYGITLEEIDACFGAYTARFAKELGR